jgi:hypothetical protein
MKKLSALAALGLLAASGAGYAATCAQDNVPAATLLVPYFKVSRGAADGSATIAPAGTNTVMAITNVSNNGVIAHFVVIDFNVPLTGNDVAFFDMRQLLNGDLNFNAATVKTEVCGTANIGYGASKYIRFTNPDTTDRSLAISKYQPLSGGFISDIRDALDESGDVTSFLSAAGANILDQDNTRCFNEVDGKNAGDFSGYMTIDVVNYCTVYSAWDNGRQYFINDAIATTGWSPNGWTPNVLMGDVFYVDPAAAGGNISGDPMVALEFDARLASADCNWYNLAGNFDANSTIDCKTFYNRYYTPFDPGSTPAGVPVAYRGIGDGREPLTSRYGFRYLNDATNGLTSWALVWRSDVWTAASFPGDKFIDLCAWWADCVTDFNNSCKGYGSWDLQHSLSINIFNNDESQVSASQQGCPSPCQTLPTPYIYLETQRIALLGNAEIGLNDANFKGGWIDLTMGGFPATHQAWVGVQHTAPGAFISVGHSATVMTNQFICVPSLFGAGNVVN